LPGCTRSSIERRCRSSRKSSGGGRFTTPALLLVRDCIIYSVTVWLVPVEYAFNLIESELVRRGVQLYRLGLIGAPSRIAQALAQQ
jgi:hypothetical protein